MFSRDITTFRQRSHRTLYSAFPQDHAASVDHYRYPRFDILDAADIAIFILAVIAVGLMFAGVI